jgi:hypothetical protein
VNAPISSAAIFGTLPQRCGSVRHASLMIASVSAAIAQSSGFSARCLAERLTLVDRQITTRNLSVKGPGSLAIMALSVAACTGSPAAGATSAAVASHTASASQPAPPMGVVHSSLLLAIPVSGRTVPWSGIVVLRGKADYRVRVGADGMFRTSVRPGSYVLTRRNLGDHPDRPLTQLAGYIFDVVPDMTPTLPRSGVSGHAGAVHLVQGVQLGVADRCGGHMPICSGKLEVPVAPPLA